MKNTCGFLLPAVALALSACSLNTAPQNRVHSAASVPRFVDVNNFPFEDDGNGKHIPVGVAAGLGYGSAWSDEGNVSGAEILHVDVHFRSPHFAAGWMPFFGEAAVTHEGTGVFGSTLWAAYHFGGGELWRFSAQSSYTVSNQITEDKGCARANWTIFTTSCTGQPESSTRAEVNVRDVGIVITAEHNLGSRNSLIAAPALHWMDVSGSSKLDSNPSGDYARRDTFWNPSFQVGYVHHFGERFRNSIAFLAGAEYAKTFRPDRVTRDWVPTLDGRWQF